MSLNFINVLWNLPIQLFGPPNAQAKFWPFLNFEGFPHDWAESAFSTVPTMWLSWVW